ncbi:MAG: hypothetical protein RL119_1348, partial [Actinomycetota bacterium]
MFETQSSLRRKLALVGRIFPAAILIASVAFFIA